eukprot:TRINITY_DN25195_c0_g1_i1.p1 TRINITY_DN25195_c0_g1~~TRINITY_DN25195_c0_g1_i1.p1  ORF type:complete len:542 (+),score=83.78 TRINITY_DN25195_c0_g1_i1:125-1750(+)
MVRMDVGEAMHGVLTSGPSQSDGDEGDRDDQARIERELESDRLFFADPPDNFVRCPTCNVIYAVNASRPPTPMDVDIATATAKAASVSAQPMLPACYSRELPRGANLSLEQATRHMARSRFRCRQCASDFCHCGVSPYHWGWSCDGWQRYQQDSNKPYGVGSCRWCSKPCVDKVKRSESLASPCCGCEEGTDFSRNPPVLSCAEKERRSCGKRLPCGHPCGGVHGERECVLPCFYGCKPRASGSATAGNRSAVVQDNVSGDDWCSICWTEPLRSAPCIRMACGHVMHQHCVEAMIRKGRETGRRLTFKNIKCPLCQSLMHHPTVDILSRGQQSMYHNVRRKALQRWVVEQRQPALRSNSLAEEEKIAKLAMGKMAFFECSQCHEPYYGGEVECGGVQENEEEDLDEDVQAALAMELVCKGCASKGQHQCPEHGTEFLAWKCRYCCEREAQYFCFGTTHFCHVCHDLWQSGVEQRRKLQAGRPCLGKHNCIFGGRHPASCKNGRDEYALGCTLCAQETECAGALHNQERKSSGWKFSACVLM